MSKAREGSRKTQGSNNGSPENPRQEVSHRFWETGQAVAGFDSHLAFSHDHPAMSESTSIQLRKRGTLTLPKVLREKHNLEEGDALYLVDLGGGAFVMTLARPRIPELSSALERIREDEGVSTEELLNGLREERRRSNEETG
jgi:bifunctional DNA-binding transcriptional regulator/antitoxin component of YhaV-PrlF toxin-antitoxin module